MRLFLMIAVMALVTAPLFAQESESKSESKSSSAKAEVKVVGARSVKVVETSKSCEGEDCESEAEVELELPAAVQKVVDAIRAKMDKADAIDIEAEVDGYKIHATKATDEGGNVTESLDISNSDEDAEEVKIEDLPEDIRKIVEAAIEECKKAAEAEAKKAEGEKKSEERKKEGSK